MEMNENTVSTSLLDMVEEYDNEIAAERHFAERWGAILPDDTDRQTRVFLQSLPINLLYHSFTHTARYLGPLIDCCVDMQENSVIVKQLLIRPCARRQGLMEKILCQIMMMILRYQPRKRLILYKCGYTMLQYTNMINRELRRYVWIMDESSLDDSGNFSLFANPEQLSAMMPLLLNRCRNRPLPTRNVIQPAAHRVFLRDAYQVASFWQANKEWPVRTWPSHFQQMLAQLQQYLDEVSSMQQQQQHHHHHCHLNIPLELEGLIDIKVFDAVNNTKFYERPTMRVCAKIMCLIDQTLGNSILLTRRINSILSSEHARVVTLSCAVYPFAPYAVDFVVPEVCDTDSNAITINVLFRNSLSSTPATCLYSSVSPERLNYATLCSCVFPLIQWTCTACVVNLGNLCHILKCSPKVAWYVIDFPNKSIHINSGEKNIYFNPSEKTCTFNNQQYSLDDFNTPEAIAVQLQQVL